MRNGKKWLRGGCRASVAALALAACYYETPAPQNFAKAQAATVPFDSIRAYAATLRFDTVRGAADFGLVDFTTGVIGPGGDSAWIEPETGAWALDSNDLAEGRIIARIRTRSVHPAQGYGPTWWTWWWVYKDRAGWHGLLLSDSLQTRVAELVTHESHGPYRWRQSIARWRSSKWGTCDRNSCCSGP